MNKQCSKCNALLDGRSNKLYCSPRCKKAVNNRSYKESTKDASILERKVRDNRNLLAQIHKIFGETPMPADIIDKTALDKGFFTSISENRDIQAFLDYTLSVHEKNFYIIKKISTNV